MVPIGVALIGGGIFIKEQHLVSQPSSILRTYSLIYVDSQLF